MFEDRDSWQFHEFIFILQFAAAAALSATV